MNACYMPNVHGVVIYNPRFPSKEIGAFGTEVTYAAFCILPYDVLFLS